MFVFISKKIIGLPVTRFVSRSGLASPFFAVSAGKNVQKKRKSKENILLKEEMVII
jgi:hypothetical protein